MLVEFPQCPRCAGDKYDPMHSETTMLDGKVYGTQPCSRCDGLGVLIPDEMVEAVGWSFPSEWLTDDFHAEIGKRVLAALVRYQQEVG